MHRRVSRLAELSARTIVLAYVMSAVLWITLSDRVLGALFSDPGTLVTLSTLKGWAFVAVTGAMLAILLRRYDAQRTRQTSELEARESRFRLLAEHAQDVISRYRVLPTPAFEYVSPSVETVLGYPPAAFYADPGLMARLVHPDDRHLLRLRRARRRWRTRSSCGWDTRTVTGCGSSSGAPRSSMRRAGSSRSRAWRVMSAIGSSRRHHSRGSTVCSAPSPRRTPPWCGQAARSISRRSCRVVVEEGAYRYAWVGYREDDEAGTVRPMTSAGYGPGHQVGMRVTWHATERGLGPVGTSVREGRTVVLADIATDPTYAPWREAARALGYVSGAAIPLCEGSQAFGALVIYSDEHDAATAEEIVLLEDLAEGLAYGVGTLRARAIREAGEAERARLATAIEQTAESVVITDLPPTSCTSTPPSSGPRATPPPRWSAGTPGSSRAVSCPAPSTPTCGRRSRPARPGRGSSSTAARMGPRSPRRPRSRRSSMLGVPCVPSSECSAMSPASGHSRPETSPRPRAGPHRGCARGASTARYRGADGRGDLPPRRRAAGDRDGVAPGPGARRQRAAPGNDRRRRAGARSEEPRPQAERAAPDARRAGTVGRGLASASRPPVPRRSPGHRPARPGLCAGPLGNDPHRPPDGRLQGS